MTGVAAPRRLAVCGGRLLTEIDGGLRLVDGDLLIEGGRITAITDRLQDGRDGPHVDETLDATGCIVTPGLVNAHTHSPENLAAARAEMAGFDAWMRAVWPPLDGLEPRDTRLAILIGAAEMIRSGVTGVVDHLRRTPMTAAALDAALGAHAQTGMTVCVAVMLRDATDAGGRPVDAPHLATPPQADAQLALVLEAARAAPSYGLRVILGPSAPHRCSDAMLDGVAAAHARGHALHTHLDETAAIAAAGHRRFGRSTTAELAARGMLDEGVALAHCVGVSADDVARIARAGALVLHNPVANMRLGVGLCDTPSLRAAGVRIALGTDGAASNDGQNLWESLKLAALAQRRPSLDPARWPSPLEVWSWATRGGQHALRGVDAAAGLLAPGAPADVAVFEDLHACRDAVTAAARLVLGSTARVARHAIAGGRVLLRDGVLTTIDPMRLRMEALERNHERAA